MRWEGEEGMSILGYTRGPGIGTATAWNLDKMLNHRTCIVNMYVRK